MRISIIIPVWNEADHIPKTLMALQPFRAKGHEVIVVDGGSRDDSLKLSQPFADRILLSKRGRSRQMNAGAGIATGDTFLFLHADTFLLEGADRFIIEGMKGKEFGWGHFDVNLSGKRFLFRIIEFLMNWRSRFSGIATGDQAIFVKRDLFETIGGFPEVDLMEDIALSKLLKKYGRPLCLRNRVTTSSRRWEEKGVLHSILLMWFLRFAYFFKVNPNRLAKLYYPKFKCYE